LIGGVGTEEKNFGGFRYGGTISKKAWYRLYVKHNDGDGSVNNAGMDIPDDWDMQRSGDNGHRLTLDRRNEITWGLGYRYTSDEITNSFYTSFDPAILRKEVMI